MCMICCRQSPTSRLARQFPGAAWAAGIRTERLIMGVVLPLMLASARPTLLATTGLATTGLAITGLAITGLATMGLARTGLATTVLATTGLATTGRRPPDPRTTAQAAPWARYRRGARW